MNWKLIIKVIGVLLSIEAGLMAVCMVVGYCYGDCYYPFVWPTLITSAVSVLCRVLSRKAPSTMSRKDGYFIVTLSWISFSVAGMFPFLLSGTLPDVSSAFFEIMSGFTSTGATVIDNCDAQPHSILMWRSLSQWIGGIGIIFFTIAILPAFGVGEVKLFAAEATGPMHYKVHPRISVTAKWIGSVYVLLTALCIISLLVCGMGWFDAVNYSFVTTATGGFGTHSALLHDQFHSPAIEYVLTFFMFISGVNYTLIYYAILKGHIRRFLNDAEARCYLFIVLSVTVVCTVTLTCHRIDWTQLSTINPQLSTIEESFRESIFTVISLQTTTGLASYDYTQWPLMLMPCLLFIMFAGACSGSTSGGFKCVRWSIIYRVVRNEFQRILHPRAVLPVRMNNLVIQPQIIHTLFAFVALFTGALFGGAFVLALFGVAPDMASPDIFDYEDSLAVAMASLSNVGPALAYYGPTHSWAILTPEAKWVCSALMLIGRLEIFPVLILFTRNFWKH